MEVSPRELSPQSGVPRKKIWETKNYQRNNIRKLLWLKKNKFSDWNDSFGPWMPDHVTAEEKEERT